MRRLVGCCGLVLAVIAGASGCGYRGGSYRFVQHDMKGARLAGACLDMAVSSHALSRRFAPIVTYALGNRCDADAPLDLRRTRVWAHTMDGTRLPLAPRDPRNDLREAALAGAWGAWIHVEYTFESAPAVLPALREICVDVSGTAEGITGVVCLDPEAS
jgi:hypothetical protein